MKPFVYALCILGIASSASAAELYLEGISILGAKKKAFITVGGEKLTAVEGDSIDKWTVERIEQRSIFLRQQLEGNPQGGELRELSLHSRLSETVEPALSPPPAATQAPAEASPAEPVSGAGIFGPAPLSEPITPAPPIPDARPEPTYHRQPIPPESVPPGHRVVHTPFGDVVVKDNAEVASPTPPAENAPPAQ